MGEIVLVVTGYDGIMYERLWTTKSYFLFLTRIIFHI